MKRKWEQSLCIFLNHCICRITIQQGYVSIRENCKRRLFWSFHSVLCHTSHKKNKTRIMACYELRKSLNHLASDKMLLQYLEQDKWKLRIALTQEGIEFNSQRPFVLPLTLSPYNFTSMGETRASASSFPQSLPTRASANSKAVPGPRLVTRFPV